MCQQCDVDRYAIMKSTSIEMERTMKKVSRVKKDMHKSTIVAESETRHVRVGPKWDKNLRLFKISFSKLKCTETDCKKFQICPISGQSEPL